MSRDLIPTAEIKDLLRDAYHHVSLTTAPVAHNLYSYEGLALVPQSAIDRALGVAKPPVSRHYSVRQHCARPRVRTRHRHHLAGAPHRPHRSGNRAGLLARDGHPYCGRVCRVGLSNVEPLEGELEAIPLPDDSDLIISNGVINLSARKARCSDHGSPA
jgi:arsenite methyltransferase